MSFVCLMGLAWLPFANRCTDTQWSVDFNLSLASFEPQIQGVRNLIDFVSEAAAIGSHVRLLFTSSVGIASSITPAPLVPEARLENSHGATTGYGKSKFVAEELLVQASEKFGIDVAICRVGQIAGPIKSGYLSGQWKQNEWLPSVRNTFSPEIFCIYEQHSTNTHSGLSDHSAFAKGLDLATNSRGEWSGRVDTCRHFVLHHPRVSLHAPKGTYPVPVL